ncbi:ATP-dependent sacrificial sulfur transferase LarE [Oceanirhabdus sp. W0125-5]|uniref:ATP-dependent sacrificial sulfur transferase LarE n=1 Tax=Oceanirhabdus sp. W0125-5 TaxID=2999116 RepID=UPI0022F333BF|nr:ATP-dependent sacrificial sulfur transferase LarE [Oceanirhabdus sp. W0125-5]WBW98737.1 ATP-dependent sacrificial sulfur transferase LarE [Oceanirhabdus sp. W0125-5]
MNEAYIDLLTNLESLEKVVVAFSGGVDSTFLLYACKEVLGDNVIAVTIDSPYIPRWEIEESKELVSLFGVKHHIIKVDIPESIVKNPEDRCYLCKKEIFSNIIKYKDEIGFKYVVDGSNYDDTKDYRPGMRALQELDVRSPLLESKLTKEEIRKLSKLQKVPTWNKPAYACLLSRLPYNTEILSEELRKIELAERFIMDKGFKGIRVRSYGDTAKIEIFKEDMERFLKYDNIEEVNTHLINLGYKVVTLDLGGYSMGKMNRSIEEKKNK